MSVHLTEEQITSWLIGEREREYHVHQCPDCSEKIEAAQQAFANFREAIPRLRPRTQRALFPALATAAASLVLAAILLHHPQPTVEQPFYQIPFVAPPAPYERTEILRMELPVATLTAAGFDVQPYDPAATIPADVLVGQDGRPHAFRFVNISK